MFKRFIKYIPLFFLILGLSSCGSQTSTSVQTTTPAPTPTPTQTLPPVLRFSDISSGPANGLSDGLGSGAIVTVWGNHLGSAQNGSQIYFKDAKGVTRKVAHIYYWKNADGKLPGGPANLYSALNLQEIAFSIPNAAPGAGKIYIQKAGSNTPSNTLPFTVSTVGHIYWVAPTGNNFNNCSYNAPCKYINADISPGSGNGGLANGKLISGDIVYSIGVTEPDLCSGGRCAALFARAIVGTVTDPISFISYPGYRSKLISQNVGLQPYQSPYINMSKYAIYVGHRSPSLPPNPGNSIQSDVHIYASKGRYVGNYMGQNPNTCITGWAGAITSGGDGGENVKFFGNEIDRLGCPNTSRFQHTTYMSIRNSNTIVNKGWDFSFNYIHDNYPMFGIHFYDEQLNGGNCGKLYGTLRVTNNVIVNQRGSAINIATYHGVTGKNACWSASIHVENNIIMNTGLGGPLDNNVTPPPIAIRIGGDIASDKVNIFNNTIYHWGSKRSIAANGNPAGIQIGFNLSPPTGTTIKLLNNLVMSGLTNSNQNQFIRINNKPNFIGSIIGKNNAFYTPQLPPYATAPSTWLNNINLTQIPIMINNSNYRVKVLPGSRLIDHGVSASQGLQPLQTFDIYGTHRKNYDIGAVEYTP